MNGEHFEALKPTMLDVIEWAKKTFPIEFPPERTLTPSEVRTAHALWYSEQSNATPATTPRWGSLT